MKRANRIFWVAVLGVWPFISGSKCADVPKAPAPSVQTPIIQNDFENAFTWQQRYDEKSKKLNVTVQLKDGYHAYTTGEKIGVPVDLIVMNFNGWHAEGNPFMPEGILKNLGAIGSTKVLEKEFKIAVKAIGGKGPIKGVLKMQLCSSTACDRPREHPFELAVSSEHVHD